MFILKRIALLALLVWLLLPLKRHVESTIATFGLHGNWRTLSDADRLRASRLPTIHWVDALDERMQPGDCALVLRQAEYGFYGRGCYYSYLDEKLIPLYRATTIEATRAILAEKRIRYVFMPAYQLPELYNSRFGELLADPREAIPVWDLEHSRLFRLNPEPSGPVWPRRTLLRIDAANPLKDQTGAVSNRLDARFAKPFVDDLASAESVSTAAATGVQPGHQWCGHVLAVPRLRGFEITMQGLGYAYAVTLNGAQWFPNEVPARYGIRMIWDGVINGRRTIRGLYVVPPGLCDPFVVRFSHRGRGVIEILSGEVFEYPDWTPDPAAFMRERATARGWLAHAEGRFHGSWRWGMRADGTVFGESHPDRAARTTLATPLTEAIDAPRAGIAQVAIEAALRVSGQGRLRVYGVVHLGRQPAGTESAALATLRRALEPRSQMIATARHLLGAASGRPQFAHAAELDAERLPTLLRQEVRRALLFDGDLDAIERALVLHLAIGVADRARLEFAHEPDAAGARPASFALHALDVDAMLDAGRRPILRLDAR